MVQKTNYTNNKSTAPLDNERALSKRSMSATDADPVKLRRQLVEKYHQLLPPEQVIVQLFSVIYEPVSRAAFALCLNQTGTRDKNGKPFTQQTLKPYIEQLLAAGLLVQNSSQGPQCNSLLVEIATRDAVQRGGFESLVQVVQEKLPLPMRGKGGPRYFSSEGQLLREVRIGIYRQDIKLINQQLEDYYKNSSPKDKLSLNQIYQRVCNNPFEPTWLRTLPQELYESILVSILNDSMLELTPADAAFALLQEDCAQSTRGSNWQRILLTEQLILRGRCKEAQQVLEDLCEPERSHFANLWGWLFFLCGNDQKAIEHYTVALQALQKGAGKRKVYFQSMSGLFFVLALLKQGSRAGGETPPGNCLSEAADCASLARQSKHWLSSIYEMLENVMHVQQGELSKKDSVVNAAPDAGHHRVEMLWRALCLYWVDAERAKKLLPKLLEPFYEQAKAAGYHWLAMESAELLSRLKPRSRYGNQAKELRQNSGIRPLVDSLQPQSPWELCLNALASLHQEPQATAKPETGKRLAWFIIFYSSSWMLQPRERLLTAKGEWGKGRNVALKRLKSNPSEFDYLTPQDFKVCAHLKATYAAYGHTDYTFGEKAIAALIGHPLVFWEDAPTTRVELVKGEPELLVKKAKGDQLTLQLSPELKENKNIVLVKETPTRLKVIEIAADHRRIAEILGKQNHLEVPAKAKERVLTAINAVSGMVTVHSDIGGGMTSAEAVPAQTKPHIHLLPAGEGLKVAVLARPFAQEGPYYRPGTGGETVIAEIDGQRLQTTRALRQEKQLANAAIAACPTLASQAGGYGEWLVEEPEDCLELLLELQALGGTIVLEWPAGEKLRVSHHASLKNFGMDQKRVTV